MATTNDNNPLPLFDRHILICVQICIAGLLLFTTGCKQNTPEIRKVDSARIVNAQLPGVPNFSKVCDGLYRGGQTNHGRL